MAKTLTLKEKAAKKAKEAKDKKAKEDKDKKKKKFRGANGKYYATKAEADKNNKKPNLNGSKKNNNVKRTSPPLKSKVGHLETNGIDKKYVAGYESLSPGQPSAYENIFKTGLMYDGMTNRSKQKIQVGKGTPTLYGMAETNNYANPDFGLSMQEARPYSSKKISRAAQSARSKGAGTQLKKSVSGLNKGFFQSHTNSDIFRPSNTVSKKGGGQFTPSFRNSDLGQVYRPTDSNAFSTKSLGIVGGYNSYKAKAISSPAKITSSYGNYANPSFGLTKSPSKIKTPTMSQDQFSQNIKLISGGFGLGDTVAREKIASNTAESKARIGQINKINLKNDTARLKADPNMAEANRILAEQGADYRYIVKSVRRRRGRWYARVLTQYIGPSTRTSKMRTIHNGRQVRSYSGYSTGALISGKPSFESVVQNYNKHKGVLDFALEYTDIKPTGEYYDSTLDATKIRKDIASIETAGTKVTKGLPIYDSYWGHIIGHQPSRTGVGSVKVLLSGKVGSTARYAYLSQSQADKLKKLKEQAPKAGSLGMAAFSNFVEMKANEKKVILDKYIDPLDDVFSYAAVDATKMEEIQTYSSDLAKNNSDYDINIGLLEDGLAKINTVTGKASKTRKIGSNVSGAYDVYDTIESKETPYDTTIATTKFSLTDIGNKISGKQDIIAARNTIGLNINDLMAKGFIPKQDTLSVSKALDGIDSGLVTANAAVVSAEQELEAAYVPSYSSGSSARRAKERRRSAAKDALETAKANVVQLKSTQTQLQTQGATSYGTDKINQGVIATPDDVTITGGRTRKNNWYHGAAGSATLKIPKDKIPASGKVVVQATVTYLSGYKGPTGATTSFGDLDKGTTVVRQELPVDANGNVTIDMHMYGTKYGRQASAGVTNIKIIDPTSTNFGSKLYGDRDNLLSTQSNLSNILQENTDVKNYFDSAQEFLTGKTNTLKDKKGKVVASYADDKLNISNATKFSDLFGNLGSDVFGATRTVYAPVTKLQTREQELNTKKQTILKAGGDVSEIDQQLATLGSTLNFFTTNVEELKLGDKVVAKKDQSGKIEVFDNSAFTNYDITVPQSLLKQKPKVMGTKLTALETSLDKKEKTQTQLIEQLRDAQTSRLSESTAAQYQQITDLKNRRIINSTEAKRMKDEVKKSDAEQSELIKGEGVPLPDSIFDTSFMSESQQIRNETDTIAKDVTNAVVSELKSIQTERIKDNTTDLGNQVKYLLKKRAISRRDATKLTSDAARIAKIRSTSINAMTTIPLPNDPTIDTDLQTEAQKIVDGTNYDEFGQGLTKHQKVQNARARLRQVTRGRSPQTSRVGAVLARGTTVPRPSAANPNQNSRTTLGSQNAIVRNPFIDGR